MDGVGAVNVFVLVPCRGTILQGPRLILRNVFYVSVKHFHTSDQNNSILNATLTR